VNIEDKIKEYEASLGNKKSITSYYNFIKLKGKYTNENIYPLVKDYFNFYLDTIELENYGYDQLNNKKIISLIKFLDIKERKSVLLYLESKIKLKKPELGNEWIIDEIHKINRGIYLQDISLINGFRYILNLSSSNLYTLTLSVIILIFLFSLILIPAPFEFMELYEVKTDLFKEMCFLDRVLISSIIIFDLDEEVKLLSLTSFSVILKILGNIAFYSVFVNFIFKYFNDYLKRL